MGKRYFKERICMPYIDSEIINECYDKKLCNVHKEIYDINHITCRKCSIKCQPTYHHFLCQNCYFGDY